MVCELGVCFYKYRYMLFFSPLLIDKVATTPLSADSVAYVYHRPIEEDSDAESLIDDLWGLGIDEDSESEEDDEDEAADDEDEGHEEELDVGDLPEDLNARCNLSQIISRKQFSIH